MDVKNGVAQRSRLGPLLFTLYINELPKLVCHVTIYLFADDKLVYFSGCILIM